jgi:hypothetical protein
LLLLVLLHCLLTTLQIKLLKLLRLLGTGDKAASDNMAAVVGLALRRAAAGGSHTIGHAIVYEAVRCRGTGWQAGEGGWNIVERLA